MLLLLGACRFGFDAGGGDDDPGDGGNGDGMAPPPFEPWWRNGTRLRAITVKAIEGGDPYWIGWYDTMLGSYCANGIAIDGMERCIPHGVPAQDFYADAACTIPLGHDRPRVCHLQNQYAYRKDAMGRAQVFALGAVHTGTVYDQRAGCTPSTFSGQYYQLGPELPATSMLLAQYTKEPIDSFTRPFQGFVDGAKIETGGIETGGGSCYPQPHGLGPARCQVSAPRAIPVYRDNQCTQRAYFWDRQPYDSTSTPQLVVYAPGACELDFTLYGTIMDVTAADHFRSTAAGCTQMTTGIGRLYTAMPITDPNPQGTIVIGPRRGRLGYTYWIGPNDSAIAMRWFDHDYGLPCLPFRAGDDKLRCLPNKPVGFNERFTGNDNATCSGSERTLAAGCFGTPPVDGPNYLSCVDSPWNVTVLPQLGTSASVFSDGTCVSLDTPLGIFDPTASAGTVDPTLFPELVEIVE